MNFGQVLTGDSLCHLLICRKALVNCKYAENLEMKLLE